MHLKSWISPLLLVAVGVGLLLVPGPGASAIAAPVSGTGPRGEGDSVLSPLLANSPQLAGEVQRVSVRALPVQEAKLTPLIRLLDHYLLLDGESDLPIEGAKLVPISTSRSYPSKLTVLDQSTFFVLPAQASLWNGHGMVVAQSGADGRVCLPLERQGTRRYEVHANGFCPAWIEPQNGHPTPESARVIHLMRSATILGTILDPLADAPRALRVRVTSESSAFRKWESGDGNRSTTGLKWSARVQNDGRFELTDVPSEVPLRLDVLVGRKVLFRSPSPLVLAPDEEHQFDWVASEATDLRGILVSPGGTRDNRLLWLVPTQRKEERALLSNHERPTQTSRTRPGGDFVFEDVPPGNYWLGPAPVELQAAHDNGGSGIVALFQPGSRRAATRVTVPCPETIIFGEELSHVIQGKVEYEGRGLPGMNISARLEGMRGLTYTQADKEGRFTFNLPFEGAWSLHAQGSTGFPFGSHPDQPTYTSTPVVEETGVTDAHIEVQLGARLGGIIVDAQGDKTPARVSILRLSEGTRPIRYTSINSLFFSPSLEAGTYVVYAQTTDGRAGYSEEISLRPGDNLKNLTVQVSAAAAVRVRPTHGKAGSSLCFLVAGRKVAEALLVAHGSTTLCLPPGTYAVEIRDPKRTGARRLGEHTFIAGETRTLEIGR